MLLPLAPAEELCCSPPPDGLDPVPVVPVAPVWPPVAPVLPLLPVLPAPVSDCDPEELAVVCPLPVLALAPPELACEPAAVLLIV